MMSALMAHIIIYPFMLLCCRPESSHYHPSSMLASLCAIALGRSQLCEASIEAPPPAPALVPNKGWSRCVADCCWCLMVDGWWLLIVRDD
jgi:hypothetical protein